MRIIIFFLALIIKYVSSYLIVSIQDRHPLCHLSHSSTYMSYDIEYTRAKASYNDGMLSLNDDLTSYCFHKLLDDFDIIFKHLRHNTGNDFEYDVWPSHAIADYWGSSLFADDEIRYPKDMLTMYKAENIFEEYSGFKNPELLLLLKNNSIDNILIIGSLLEYSVFHTSIEARELGFNVGLRADLIEPFNQRKFNKTIDVLYDNNIDIFHSNCEMESFMKTNKTAILMMNFINDFYHVNGSMVNQGKDGTKTIQDLNNFFDFIKYMLFDMYYSKEL
jgi:nicotinamidase-related amidase